MPPIPDNDLSMDREPTALEQAALGWVVRSERGLSPQQESELANWLEARAEHRALYAEFGGTWTLLGRAAAESPVQSAETLSAEATLLRFELLLPSRAKVPAGWRGVRPIWLSLAAAAAVAFGFLQWRGGGRADAAIVTEVGASRQLTLSDGSIVALNTDSAVVTAFAPDERRVRLEKGEAFFQVAKDAARPFVVEAAGVGVRAIGTAFNVRVHSASIEVLVTEGRVRVAPGGGGAGEGAAFVEVAAGERVMVPIVREAHGATTAEAALAVARVPVDEMQRRLAWQGRRLDFSDTTLAEMVAEFNRYNRHQLAVADPALGSMRFGGSFRPEDRVGFVRMLREHFAIQVDERENETILRASR